MKTPLEPLIEKILQEYSVKRGFELPPAFSYDLVVTKDPAHGDFAWNAAFKLARFAGEKPNQVADELLCT